MLISQRRLKCTLILGLCVCCVLIYRPLRQQLDQLLVRNCISEQVQVSEVRLHWERSLVEARDVQWQAISGVQVNKLSADEVWFALDKGGLIDRNLRLPKVRVVGARMWRETPPTSATTSPEDIWAAQMQMRLAHLEWSAIQQECSSLEAARELTSTWRSRVDRWVSRSSEILQQAQLLESDALAEQNPLRCAQLVQEALQRTREFNTEQQILMGQFDGVQKLLKAESNRLQQLRRDDLAEIKKLGDIPAAKSGQDGHSSELDSRELANALLLQAAKQLWRQYAPFAETADGLLTASLPAARPAYDVNVRATASRRGIVELPDIQIAGLFEQGPRQIPFTAAGRWSLMQDARFQQRTRLDWHTQFHGEQAAVYLQLAHNSDVSDRHQLQLCVLAPMAPGNSVSAPLEGAVARQQALLRALFTTGNGSVDGCMWLSADGCCQLESQLKTPWSQIWQTANGQDGLATVGIEAADLEVADLEAADAEQPSRLESPAREADAIAVKVSGSWDSPVVQLATAPPAWLIAGLQRAVQQELEQTNLAAQSRLEREFDSRMHALRHAVEGTIEHGRASTQADQEQLWAIRERLQRVLRDGVSPELARQPQNYRLR